MSRVASFHLLREHSILRAMSRLGADRVRLRPARDRTSRDRRAARPVFWRLLGTGAGSDTGPGADLRRTAMFAVWDDEDALNSFTDAMAPRWSRSTEHYEVRMRAASGHGAWRGVDVVGLLPPVDAEHSGPVATITRADVRLRSWSAFRRAGAPVSEELHRAPGLLAVVGIGEAPVGRLGTFALWRDHESLIAFARKMPVHRAVVQRTRTEAWYGEELFARFVPYASSGSWDGRDPLAGRLARSTGTNIP